MKKLMIFLIVFFLAGSCYASSYGFEFVRDYISSLQHLKDCQGTINNEPNYSDYENEMDYVAALKSNLHLAKSQLQQGISLIEKYKESKNSIIAKAAGMILISYDWHMKIIQEGLDIKHEFRINPRDYNKEEAAAKNRVQKRQIDDAMEMLVNCSILVSHVLISQKPDEKGRMSYLAINSNERQRLLKQLDEVFGKEIEVEVSEESNRLDACADILREILTGVHKSSDER